MKILRTMVLLFAFALLLQSPSHANDTYPNGFVNSDGYTWNNGYWYYGSQAYTRVSYWQPGYYRNCCYVNGYYFYKYFPYSPPLPSYTDSNWRSKLLDLAAHRDKVEGEIRKNIVEQQHYLEAVNALGLQGNFRWGSYGNFPIGAYSVFNTYSNQAYGAGVVNANTQYGYSYQSIAQLYGDTNLNALYQQAAQLANGSQRLAGEATAGFQGAVAQEGGNRARVAEILAKGQMAQQIISTLQASPSSTIETKGFSFKIGPGGAIQRIEENVPQDTKTKLLADWQNLVTAKCLPCHDSKNKKGNFDIATYPGQPMDIKQKIWAVLMSPDDKVVMPRALDGGPGKRLTQDELRLFFLN